MSRFKAIIFDFDGIIAESLEVKTEAFGELYSQYGKDIEQKVKDHHLANGGMSRYEKFRVYHNEFLNLEIDNQTVESMANQFSDLVLTKVSDAPSVAGADEFIKKYHDVYDLFISTGTPTDEIKIILKNRKLDQYFKGVYGSPEYKSSHVKKILKENGYNKSEVVFIGDATADRDAAKANQIEFIGRYTTSEEILKEKNLIKDIENLNKYLLTL